MISSILGKCLQNNGLITVGDLVSLLQIKDSSGIRQLHAAAKKLKQSEVGTKVFLRGLLELSNVCEKDCRYCGIRKGNPAVQHYQMSLEEIETAAIWAWENGFGSLVLQGGERRNPSFVSYIEKALIRIHKATNSELKITLSLGEQSLDTYQIWYQAGAHRYLLRIETTNPVLYGTLHPADHDFNERLDCLGRLCEVGYQVGSGVLMGTPGQTFKDLAHDLLFLKKQDVDMIGMGPFIPHNDTPMAVVVNDFDPASQLRLGLNMIAAARLLLRDVNIASTTALEALAPRGREMGLLAGANVVMPNLTPLKYRQGYQLYRGKPGLVEDTTQSLQALDKMVNGTGESIGFGEPGDSLHFKRRIKEPSK